MEKLNFFDVQLVKRIAYWCLLAALVGIFSGIASTLFLHSVNWAIDFRKSHTWLILFLPLMGFLVAWFYKVYGKNVERGNNLILDEIHEPQKKISFRMFPMIFISTVVSHLFGASVGREGAAVQMCGAIADQMAKYFSTFIKNRKLVLMMGMSAGFSAVFGAPVAGAIFGPEVIFVSAIEYNALLPCALAAVAGYYTTLLLGVTHVHYFYADVLPISVKGVISAVIAGIFFGYAAKFFVWVTHKVKDQLQKRVLNSLLHPAVGGMILVIVFYALGTDRYHSLGEEFIQASFTKHMYPWDFVGKTFTTAISVGSGFKGGEVMSLFYIGATMGNALAFILPLEFPVLAALGFVSVFSAAVNTPLASMFLAIEFFGPGIAVYAILAIAVSYLVSGKSGIYHAQRNHSEKNIWFK